MDHYFHKMSFCGFQKVEMSMSISSDSMVICGNLEEAFFESVEELSPTL